MKKGEGLTSTLWHTQANLLPFFLAQSNFIYIILQLLAVYFLPPNSQTTLTSQGKNNQIKKKKISLFSFPHLPVESLYCLNQVESRGHESVDAVGLLVQMKISNPSVLANIIPISLELFQTPSAGRNDGF